MSELQSIESALKRAARRRRLERIWRGFWQGLLAGGLVWLLVFAVYKIRPLPEAWLIAAAITGAVLLLAGVIAGALGKSSLLETARWVDDKKHLQERLSTALEVASLSATGNWKELLVSDAARHAKDLDPGRLVPLRLPAIGRWALLVLVLGVGLGFVPEHRSKAYVQRKKDAANIRETGKQLAEFTKRYMEQRPPVMEATTRAMETVSELGDKLGKMTLTRS